MPARLPVDLCLAFAGALCLLPATWIRRQLQALATRDAGIESLPKDEGPRRWSIGRATAIA
jgi:hypothetical protein